MRNHTSNNQILDNSNNDNSKACAFACNKRFLDAPKEQEFHAKVKLKDGLIFLLHSYDMNDIGTAKIKPFRYLSSSMPPTTNL